MGWFDIILILIPIISYVALTLSVRAGKIAGMYLFVVVTIATLILGMISLSNITPFNMSPSDMRDVVLDVLTFTYIVAVVYGAFYGARSHNVERIIVGGAFVLLVSLIAAVV